MILPERVLGNSVTMYTSRGPAIEADHWLKVAYRRFRPGRSDG